MRKNGIVVKAEIVEHVKGILNRARKTCASYIPVDGVYGDYYFKPCDKKSEQGVRRAISKAKKIYNEEAREYERVTGIKAYKIK